MQVQELSAGNPFDGPESWDVLIVEEVLGPGMAEGTDHRSPSILRAA